MPNSRNYVFTYFKFPEHYKDYLLKLEKIPNFRYVVAQVEECPETKKNHIQGYIEFSKKIGMKPIRKIMTGIHLEIRRGTRQQARQYCMKLDSRILPPFELGNFMEGGQGKRNDITKLKTLIESGKSLKQIVLEDCSNFQSIRIAEKLFQYNDNPRDHNKPPVVRWYYGATGTGKTKSVYDEFKSENIYPSFSYRWWDGYTSQKCILIDDMRRDYAKFHILLKLLDRYPHIVQIKGGTRHINSPYIIITSAYHPKDLYETREDINQLLRRITTIKHYKTRTFEGNLRSETLSLPDREISPLDLSQTSETSDETMF